MCCNKTLHVVKHANAINGRTSLQQQQAAVHIDIVYAHTNYLLDNLCIVICVLNLQNLHALFTRDVKFSLFSNLNDNS